MNSYLQPVSHMVNITNQFFSFLSFDLCQWLTGCISSEEKRRSQAVFVCSAKPCCASPPIWLLCTHLRFLSDKTRWRIIKSHNSKKKTNSNCFILISVIYTPVPEDRSIPATVPALVYFQLICLVNFVFSFIYKCGGGIVCKRHVKKNV